MKEQPEMSRPNATSDQNRAYKAVKIGLVFPIPVMAVIIFFVAAGAGSEHSVIRGFIVSVAYLAVIIPTAIFILYKRRNLAENKVNQKSFGAPLS